jgi:chromate reductase
MLTRKCLRVGPLIACRMSTTIQIDSGLLRNAKILCISGSCRNGSFNQKLLKCAAQMASDRESADVTIIDMKEYNLPVFCEDIENDQISDSARELKKMFIETDGFIFACPEYNGTMTPLLNNLIAWMNRPFSKEEKMYTPFKGKFALLTSTSPGTVPPPPIQ